MYGICCQNEPFWLLSLSNAAPDVCLCPGLPTSGCSGLVVHLSSNGYEVDYHHVLECPWLGDHDKCKNIRLAFAPPLPSIICFHETTLTDITSFKVASFLPGSHSTSLAFLGSTGASRGLLCAWDSSFLALISSCWRSLHYVHLHIVCFRHHLHRHQLPCLVCPW